MTTAKSKVQKTSDC